MSHYAAQLAALHRAVTGGAEETMLPLVSPARRECFTPARRLDVYRQGYLIRLRKALAADYPATAHYLGADAFRKSAISYIRATPSPFWDLNLYSLGYAEFLKTHSEDGFAQDLAVLEGALAETRWLPDSDAWTPAPELTPEALLELPLRLRAASRLLALEFPAAEYLDAFRQGEISGAPKAGPHHYLTLRHRDTVQCHLLEPEEYRALQQPSLGAALELAGTPERVQCWLGQWIAEGFLRDS